jgi:hypothetical protein
MASLNAQISFSDHSSLLQKTNLTSGIAVAVADMNADGLDDVVRLDSARSLSIEYQSPNGEPFTSFTYGSVPGRAWAIAVADVNNDGFNDILTGGRYDDVKVLTAIDNAAAYNLAMLPGETIFVQGANLADIDNDGWLDVFACHDDGESRIWGNNGDGTFAQANDWIDMKTVPVSDNSGNYGSVWTDFDNDGDLDLYIAKCRINVNNPDDPRRINALFVNDGKGNYAEAADRFGLKIKWQSWTSDFQDIDNDGDLDCLVTNHDYNLQLLENDGAGHFTDISEAAGITGLNGEFLQGIMRDFDNDGFVDILTAEPTHLLRNNGDKTFSQISHPFGNSLGTLACGDLNHDGFPDLFAANPCNINSFPCNQPVLDKLWINGGDTSHHFLAVTLEGTTSNRSAVGARLEIHGDWGIQIREVRSGESYGIMNSLTQFFGLGKATAVDYLVVRWTSGTIDVVKNPAIDQFLTLSEGSTCTLPAFDLQTDGDLVLCPGEPPLTLSAPAGYDYLWNNGATSPGITTALPGNYSVIIVDSLGCAAKSNPLLISTDPDETPGIAASGETTFCQGKGIVLTAQSGTDYTWSDGTTGDTLLATGTGDYFVINHGICGDFTSDTLHLDMLPAPAPLVKDTTIATPQPVTLVAQGNAPRWYDSPGAGATPIATGDTLVTPEITETTTFFVEDVYTYGGESFEAGMKEHQGTLFNGNNFNGQLLFDVEQAFTLQQVTVTTDSAGIRVVELRNTAGDVLQADTVDLPAGETVIDLGFFIQPGTGYRLTTNQAMNQATLGTNSPRLRRSDLGVLYPYVTPGVLRITGTNFGAGFYYYFFNWKIQLETTDCSSERIPVTVTLEPSSVRETLPFGSLTLMPNPSDGHFFLDILPVQGGKTALTLCDAYGRPVLEQSFETTSHRSQTVRIDAAYLPPGLYFLIVKTGERIGKAKLAVK